MFSFKAVTHKNVMIKVDKYPGKLATVETVASLLVHYAVADDNACFLGLCGVNSCLGRTRSTTSIL